MKAKVDKELCIGCGICENICPEIFEMADGISHVKVDSIAEEFEKCTLEAEQECPVDAISNK